MSVSNLSGTKWLWNASLSNIATGTQFYVTYSSNETDYDSLVVVASGRIRYVAGTSINTVYSRGAWSSEEYRTIEFTGGTDATNATLISYIEANATQVIEPSDSVSILLGNTEIASITESGSVTLATSETFCTSDITIDFTSSGNSSVTAKLGNVSIATMSSSGSVSLATAGTYVAEDITITYTA